LPSASADFQRTATSQSWQSLHEWLDHSRVTEHAERFGGAVTQFRIGLLKNLDERFDRPAIARRAEVFNRPGAHVPVFVGVLQLSNEALDGLCHFSALHETDRF
jgi:hypothetical protein